MKIILNGDEDRQTRALLAWAWAVLPSMKEPQFTNALADAGVALRRLSPLIFTRELTRLCLDVLGLPCRGECSKGGQTCSSVHKGWACTLKAKHPGPHVACATHRHALLTWETKEESDD